ncbi:MAG TPA: T9SS type A sorting domain-containing protein [Chitinophagaceae bacterium]|nr:T9SS type A sorting domain-containing protein [Chitinophagaceae bacterium]
MRKGFIIFISFFISISGFSQFPLTTPVYNQDFNTLANSGTSSVLPTGWVLSEGGSNANALYAAGTGSSNTGDTYSFGSIASTDRAFGGLQSGALIPTIGFYVTNNLGATITSIQISYTGEQWRLGATGRTDRLDFQYSLNAASLTTGTWTDVDALDFITPNTTTLGALDGNAAANKTLISSIITNINIPSGTNFFFRWTDLNIAGSEDGLSIDDFTLTVIGSIPVSTDYYRSIASGAWNNIATWEISPDGNDPWTAAASPPDLNSNTITIRNGNIVTITSTVTADQIIIENGGVLENQTAAPDFFTVADGTGDDMNIQPGGIYRVTSSQSFANHIAINSGAIIHIQAGGTIQINNNGGSNTFYASTMTSFVWEDSSIFNWNTSASAGMQATFFPDVDDSTIPIFRFSANQGLPLGGGTDTTIINGILETSVNLIFQGGFHKYFRNGIRGAGDVTNSTVTKIIINGITAELGGSGVIYVNATGGLEIGGSLSGNITTVTSNKTIDGYVSLINTGPGTYIDLGSYNLTVTEEIFGGSATSYIRTDVNGGVLTLNTISTSKLFPVGETTYNPVTISSTSGNNFSVRARTGIYDPGPATAIPTDAVYRTWYINANAVTNNVTVTFQYSNNPGELTANAATQPNSMEILQSDYIAWHLSPGNTTIMSAGANPYTVTNAAALQINDVPIPYALGVTGTIFLSVDCIITCDARKQNNKSIVGFDINTCAEVTSFEVQRSVNGSSFETISVIQPDLNLTRFEYQDLNLQKGTNLYRIKVNRYGGSIKYSNTVAIINDSKGVLITSIAPNPVADDAVLNISSAKQGAIHLAIYNMAGVAVKQWTATVQEGSNTIHFNTGKLMGGIYHLVAVSDESKSVLRFVKQ